MRGSKPPVLPITPSGIVTATRPGLEPRMRGSKPPVLPITPSGMLNGLKDNETRRYFQRNKGKKIKILGDKNK